MGLDPTDDDYTAGVPCPTCHDVSFGGVTPKFVFAHFSGVTRCPFGLGQNPNGTWKLTQVDGFPCLWLGVVAGWLCFYGLLVGSSVTLLSQVSANEAFFGDDDDCHSFFTNQLDCDDIEVDWSGGQCTITWGPDSPCP